MYKKTDRDVIIRIEDGLYIPMVAGNRHYDEYLEWVAAGNLAEGHTSPPALVPDVVSMRQTRLALHAAGHLATVNAAVSVMPMEAQIEWEYATEVRRDNGLTAVLAGLLSLDDTALDSLFTVAAQL